MREPVVLAFDPEEDDTSGSQAPSKASLSWKKRAAGGAGFAGALTLILAVILSRHQGLLATNERIATAQRTLAGTPSQREFLSPTVAGAAGPSLSAERQLKGLGEIQNQPSDLPSAASAPMIARTAALKIQVKDYSSARASLDSILAKHKGYYATLAIGTPENGQRNFQASVRIPASDLMVGLNDLKLLGRVLTESQACEEVTQQHADLLARLQNSRQTEERLRAILQQRTGKIEDVLQVEEEIARVRGEIESMDSEQKALEHRVTFARVDLQLVEEYNEQFGSSPISTTARLRNSFVEGMQNAFAILLGLVLFTEEFGPTILICVIAAVPAFLIWGRYRKARARG